MTQIYNRIVYERTLMRECAGMRDIKIVFRVLLLFDTTVEERGRLVCVRISNLYSREIHVKTEHGLNEIR